MDQSATFVLPRTLIPSADADGTASYCSRATNGHIKTSKEDKSS